MTPREPVHAVLDTNVFVSALLKPQSVPGSIIEALRRRQLVPIVSDGILSEYRSVLFREKFRFEDRALALLRQMLPASLHYMPEPAPASLRMPDLKDVVFYTTALAARRAGKNAYLVTGNMKHFPQEDFVVSPRAMLDILGKPLP